jgi:dolichol-phosphate mannosyltransferase
MEVIATECVPVPIRGRRNQWCRSGNTEEVVDVSVVVPTLNEGENLPALVRRIRIALGGISYEVLVVDDGSSDETPNVCAQLAAQGHPLRLHVRERPEAGLSGAVLHGFSRARGNVLAVMDADLQHPPEYLPALICPVGAGEADFAIGSRYVNGGAVHEEWGICRQANSYVATLLARPLVGRLRDPMSGFFAVRRDTVQQAKPLNPLGYKIALELMCKCSLRRIREVPIRFDRRAAGRSKLTTSQQLRFLRHLARLYVFQISRSALVLSACRLIRAGNTEWWPLLRFRTAAHGRKP